MSKTSDARAKANLAKEIKNLAASERHLEIELAKEIKALSREIKKIKSMEVIKIFARPWKFLWLALLKGIMVGFGSVLGATVFLSIFVYILSQISLVPFVGGFVTDVIQEIAPQSQVEVQAPEVDTTVVL